MKRLNSKINFESADSRAKFVSDHAPGHYIGKSSPDTSVFIVVENNGDLIVNVERAGTGRSPDKVTYDRNGKIKYVETAF